MRLQNYPAIVRTKKLSSWGAVGSSAAHTWRTITVAHADPTRTHLNEDWRPVSSIEALRAALKERHALADTKAVRPVLAIEYLITAPHEAFEESGGPVAWRAYFEDALDWIERRHGRENVVAVNIQLDEATPHLVAYACPLVSREATTRTRSVLGRKDGKTGRQVRETRTEVVPAHIALSADHYVGTREKMIRMQTEFAAEVGERHGLRRGIERSALTHVNLKAYHDALMRGIQQRLEIDPEILKRRGGLMSKESPEAMAARVAEALQEQVEGLMAQVATADLDRQRAREWEQTAARAQADRRREQVAHRATRQQLEALAGGLTAGQVEKVREYRQRCLAKHAEARRQREAEERARKTQEQAAMVAHLKALTPGELARLPEVERRPLWDLLVVRSDLAPVLDRMLDSGWFEPSGLPRQVGRMECGAHESAQNEPTQTAQNEPVRPLGSPDNGAVPSM